MGSYALVGMAGVALSLAASLASAQQAAPPLAVTNPIYATPSFEITVNAPANAVWARVGKFCDIQEWRMVSCVITAGAENEVGAVRFLNGRVIEMLVSKTDLSYTYTQPVRVGVPFDAAHGTLEVKPMGAATSKLIYSFFYDTSMLPDDAARAAELAGRRGRIMPALQNMKILAEGGTLPPPPTPAR